MAAQLKSFGPKFIPFIVSLIIYFSVYIPENEPSILAAILKILPIVSLILFVYLHGIGLGKENEYTRNIFKGLIFGCIGDVCLVFEEELFLWGVLAFGIGHLHYISAYGFKPLATSTAVGCYTFTLAYQYFMFHNIPGTFRWACTIYALIITATLWRAIARIQVTKEKWSWTRLCSCLGLISFTISDSTLTMNKWISPVPYAQLIVMITYYGAQLGNAMSVIDAKEMYLKGKKFKR